MFKIRQTSRKLHLFIILESLFCKISSLRSNKNTIASSANMDCLIVFCWGGHPFSTYAPYDQFFTPTPLAYTCMHRVPLFCIHDFTNLIPLCFDVTHMSQFPHNVLPHNSKRLTFKQLAFLWCSQVAVKSSCF